MIEKIKSLEDFNKTDIELMKVFFYEGKYSSKLISNLKWSCNQKISELNKMIKKEQILLNIISQEKLSRNLRKKISLHVEEIKSQLEDKKKDIFSYVDKQSRNFEGQKNLLKDIVGNPLVELKYTPLKQSNGEIYQKGVDVLLATDLIHLAHIDAYDIAIILSGDTDLIEAVKLIKNIGKIPIIISYHYPGNPKLSNISDLMTCGKFINIKDLTEEEINSISELRN
ncbi:MAG: NYN domain-containing protein [Candidatus Pacearchaeota archaeon]